MINSPQKVGEFKSYTPAHVVLQYQEFILSAFNLIFLQISLFIVISVAKVRGDLASEEQ